MRYPFEEHPYFAVTALEAFGDVQVAKLADAAARGEISIVNALMAQGVNAHALAREDIRGSMFDEPISVFEWAMYAGTELTNDVLLAFFKAGIVPAVLKSYVKGRAMDKEYSDMVMDADAEMLGALLEAGINPDLRDTRRELSLLCHAIEEDWEEGFNLLLSHGADPNLAHCHEEQDTPLHYAVRTWWHDNGDRHGKYILPLLEAGADPRATNIVGKTFQYYLTEIDETQASKKFIDNKRKVEAWLAEHGIALETDDEDDNGNEATNASLSRHGSEHNEITDLEAIMDKLHQSVAQFVAMQDGDGEISAGAYYRHRDGEPRGDCIYD